jgi:hypothetical protein
MTMGKEVVIRLQITMPNLSKDEDPQVFADLIEHLLFEALYVGKVLSNKDFPFALNSIQSTYAVIEPSKAAGKKRKKGRPTPT